MVLMDLTKAPNVKGYGKKVADEMLFFFLGLLFFSSILFVFLLLFIFYLA